MNKPLPAPGEKVKVCDTLKANASIIHLSTPGRNYPPVEYTVTGKPIYEIPYDYASRILANLGGRVFKLISPDNLQVLIPNNSFGRMPKILTAEVCGMDESGEEVWTKVDTLVKVQGTDELVAQPKVVESKPEPIIEVRDGKKRGKQVKTALKEAVTTEDFDLDGVHL
jgi:hypothetical protein